MSPAMSIGGIIPAAGISQRLGQDKRQLSYRGASLLEAAVACLSRGGVTPIIVVLEPDSPCRYLAGLTHTLHAINPAAERGMLSSIREGLRILPPAAQAAAILPGDHPFVPPAAVAALVQLFCEEQPLLLVPRYAGKRGHPLIVQRPLFAEAIACDDDVGLRQLLQRRAKDVREVDFDYPGADDDLDVPADLLRLGR